MQGGVLGALCNYELALELDPRNKRRATGQQSVILPFVLHNYDLLLNMKGVVSACHSSAEHIAYNFKRRPRQQLSCRTFHAFHLTMLGLLQRHKLIFTLLLSTPYNMG